MKFSWKVFFSTIIMILITFSIGGYLLVAALFESSYEREVASAKEENKMLQFSIATALSAITEDGDSVKDNTIADIVNSMVATINGKKMLLRVSNQNYKVIYQTKGVKFDNKLLKSINSKNRGNTLLEQNKEYYIQTASMIHLGEQQIYLESFRNISGIYTEREEQYRIYQQLLIGLIVINGIISYLISLWITYPIKKVSRVAHKISNGSLDNRVSIRSKDEIGRLAEDFNRMTDSLEEKIHQLQEAARRQEDFIGSFAHELKTPLTSIIGYADILRSNKMTTEMIVLSADYIFKEGIRLEALSLKLLELIVMQKQELDLKKVRAKQLFDEVQGLVSPVLEKEGIHITLEIQDTWLYLEPDLMKTVLINLIDNGKKAIEGTGFITIKGIIEKDGYSIYVQDSGKGIPQEELSKITEAFYMVDKSRAREKGGAGLGLAICLEIIKRHHGVINFESTVGIGTTVHVFLKEEGEV